MKLCLVKTSSIGPHQSSRGTIPLEISKEWELSFTNPDCAINLRDLEGAIEIIRNNYSHSLIILNDGALVRGQHCVDELLS